MTVTSIDSIVRNFIMKRGYSFHWYIQFLVYAKDCLRELSLDDLKVINTKELDVGAQNEVDLPNDYLDFVEVAVKVGQNLKPLVETDKINPLVARTSTFEATTYSQSAVTPNNQVYYGALYPFYYHTTFWNEYGEPIGRLFGNGAGVQDDVFSVFPERNQIQLTENIFADKIVLRYISDGMNADAATQITPYAYDTITQYIYWQMCENTRTYSMGEKERARQMYIEARQILRARVSDLNVEVLTRIIQKSSYASPKSK